MGMGDTENIRVQNIRVEDRLPVLNAFQLSSESGYLRNIVFEDITIANWSSQHACDPSGHGCDCIPACKPGPLPYGIPNVIGQVGSGKEISDIAFDNVRIAGTTLS